MDWKTLKRNAQLRNNQHSFKREVSNNRNDKAVLPKHYQLSSKLIRLFKSFNRRPSKKCIVSRSESYAKSSEEENSENSEYENSENSEDENSEDENSN